MVVWDGEERGRRGGTEETFAEARRRGVSVVWVDAQAPHAWQLVSPSIPYDGAKSGVRTRPSGDMDIAALATSVREILDVPFPKPADHPPVHPEAKGKRRKHVDGNAYRRELIKTLKQFYAERKRRIAFGPLVWALFGNAVAEFRMRAKGIVPPDFEKMFAPEWQEAEADETPSSRAVVDQVMKQVRPYFVWPDALAVRYAQAYRGAFLALYAFSAIAVGAALLPSAAGWMHEPGPPARSETACVLVEFSVILLVVALVFFGRRQRWLGRWTDYRLAAELLRPLSVLALLGGSRPLPQPEILFSVRRAQLVEGNKGRIDPELVDLRFATEEPAVRHALADVASVFETSEPAAGVAARESFAELWSRGLAGEPEEGELDVRVIGREPVPPLGLVLGSGPGLAGTDAIRTHRRSASVSAPGPLRSGAAGRSAASSDVAASGAAHAPSWKNRHSTSRRGSSSR